MKSALTFSKRVCVQHRCGHSQWHKVTEDNPLRVRHTTDWLATTLCSACYRVDEDKRLAELPQNRRWR